jgi:hypothetical protein
METLQPESIPVVPESPSLILRATHIVLVRIASADVRPWTNRADGMPERAADLVLELEEILKGDVDGHTGDRFRLEITQTGRPGSRVFALPGVWSDLPLDVGTRYVAFSVSDRHKAVDVMQGPALVRVAPAGEALLDARLALSGERERLSLARLLERVSEQDRSQLNHFFGEYVAARLADAFTGSPNEFDGVMRFVEDPKLSPICRTIIVEAAHAQIAGSGVAEPVLARFVRAAFHLLAMPEAAAMHDQLVSDMLPQTLGLGTATPTITAERAFSAAPAERQQAEQTLTRSTDQQAAQRLIRWLRR